MATKKPNKHGLKFIVQVDGEPALLDANVVIDKLTGPAGAPGRPGKNGQSPLNGKDGKPGKDGKDGEPGKRGPIGFRGAQGEPGPVGERGPMGKRGPVGPRGLTGAGVPGKDGKDGRQGIKGEKGDPGPQGEKGDPGKTGDRGVNWRGNWNPREVYFENDAVFYEGSSYIATRTTTGQIPSKQAGFDLMAAQGSPGGGARRRGSDGSGGSYTDAQARDAVGNIVQDSSTVDFTYVSNTSLTAIVKDNSVGVGKLTVSATDRLLGRDTAGAGAAEEITVGGGLEFTGSGGIQRSALTGDVTASAGSNAMTIANGAVTFAKMQNVVGFSVIGRANSVNSSPVEITASAGGHVLRMNAAGDTLAFGTLIAENFADNTIAYSRLVSLGAGQLIGRRSGSAGAPEAVSPTSDLVMSAGAALSIAAFTGDVTKAEGGTALTIANNAVTDAKLRDSAALSVIGRAANSTGDPADITAAANDRLFARTGDTLAFQQLTNGMVPTNTIGLNKLANPGAEKLVGQSASSGAAIAIGVPYAGGLEFNSTDLQIHNSGVSYAMMQLVGNTYSLLGNNSGSSNQTVAEIVSTAAIMGFLTGTDRLTSLLTKVEYIGPGNLADDAAYSITLPSSATIAYILVVPNVASGRIALVHVRSTAGTQAVTVLASAGGAVGVYNTALTGTTGTDAQLNLGVASGGAFYVENRTGALRAYTFYIFYQ